MEENALLEKKSFFTVTIDRIEGMFAVCEIAGMEETKDVELSVFPKTVQEGERYQMSYSQGEGWKYIDQIHPKEYDGSVVSQVKRRLRSRWIRFS